MWVSCSQSRILHENEKKGERMSDLISREYLINTFSKNSIFQKVTNAEGKNVIEIIQNAPTAFDVGKVVKQLKKRMKSLRNDYAPDLADIVEEDLEIINEAQQCKTKESGKLTNRDRLRSMDDAEFAEFLIEESKYGHLARHGDIWVKWWLGQEVSNEDY